jgi:hypothetical protein
MLLQNFVMRRDVSANARDESQQFQFDTLAMLRIRITRLIDRKPTRMTHGFP